MTLSARLLCGTALCLILAGKPAFAADALPRKSDPVLPVFTQLPAVDGINGKLSGFGGWIDNDNRTIFAPPGLPGFGFQRPNRSQALFGAAGSLSAPLGQRFGVQIDGLASSARGAFFGGGAVHLFSRDPAVGLIGLYGSATRSNAFGGANRYKAGLEAEAYFGRFTISGVAGWEQTRTGGFGFVGTFGGQNFFAVGTTTNRFFDAVDISYYPIDNWRVSVGHRLSGGQHMAAVATEYLFPLGGGTAAAVFVEGRIGDRNNRAIFGGLTFYFGQKDKTLIRRHREDDPPNRLLDDMFSGGVNNGGSGTGGSKGKKLIGVPGAAPPPPPLCQPQPYCNYT